MKTTSLPPAVVLGNAATGLYVARELGRAGVRVYGVSRARECGDASRYLQACAVCPTSEDTLDFLFREVAHEGAKPVLIPTSDHFIDFVSANAARLSEHFTFQQSYANGLARSLVSKSGLYQLCVDQNIALPNWMTVTRTSIHAMLGELIFPVFLKPCQIHEIKSEMKGKKGWVLQNEADLERIIPSLPAGDHSYIAQEIVPGPESDIHLHCAYFDSLSRPHQSFTGRKLRQYPPGFGSASIVVSEACEEAKEISERFLTAIGFQGIAASEFKRDPRDGRLKLIEINPRPSLWFSVATAAGKKVSLAAFHDLGDTGASPPESEQVDQIGWRYFSRDLYSSYFYKKASDFVLPRPDVDAYRRALKRIDAVFCRDDPAPAFSEWTSSMKSFLRRVSRANGNENRHV